MTVTTTTVFVGWELIVLILAFIGLFMATKADHALSVLVALILIIATFCLCLHHGVKIETTETAPLFEVTDEIVSTL